MSKFVLFGGKEAGAGATGADPNLDFSQTSGAASFVCSSGRISVNSLINFTAFK